MPWRAAGVGTARPVRRRSARSDPTRPIYGAEPLQSRQRDPHQRSRLVLCCCSCDEPRRWLGEETSLSALRTHRPPYAMALNGGRIAKVMFFAPGYDHRAITWTLEYVADATSVG